MPTPIASNQHQADVGRTSPMTVLRHVVRGWSINRSLVIAGVALWGVVAANALFRQEGPHPAPLFEVAQSDVVRQDALARPVATMPPSRPAAEGPDELALVQQIQQALAARGYDVGTVDGVFGPRTEAAIVAFARDTGHEVRGLSNAELLARITGAAAGAQSAPQRRVRTTPIRIDDLIAEHPAAAEPQASQPSAVADPLVLAVQRVLAELGYGPGSIDGVVGPATRQAILSFRADRGLAGGGTVTDDLIAELASVTGKPVVP